MQILLIWEELADLSNMIIAPPSPLTAWLTFYGYFLQFRSLTETHKVPASIHWGTGQTAQDAPTRCRLMAEIYYSCLSLAIMRKYYYHEI